MYLKWCLGSLCLIWDSLASWLSLTSLEICSTTQSDSSSCDVALCKSLLAVNTLLKMYSTTDFDLQIINAKTI